MAFVTYHKKALKKLFLKLAFQKIWPYFSGHFFNVGSLGGKDLSGITLLSCFLANAVENTCSKRFWKIKNNKNIRNSFCVEVKWQMWLKCIRGWLKTTKWLTKRILSEAPTMIGCNEWFSKYALTAFKLLYINY